MTNEGNHFNLEMKGKFVFLTVRASSVQSAEKVYQMLEFLMAHMTRSDLEDNWNGRSQGDSK